MKLHYIIGDVTKPIKKPAMICHINNDIGGWGRGVVLAIGRIFPEAERAYRSRFNSGDPLKLGETQLVEISNNDGSFSGVYVANMVAQHDIRWQGKVPPIRYDALEECLNFVYTNASEYGCSVHMPRIGCALAGGSWNEIGPIVERLMTVETYVYTLSDQKNRWNDEYEDINEFV